MAVELGDMGGDGESTRLAIGGDGDGIRRTRVDGAIYGNARRLKPS